MAASFAISLLVTAFILSLVAVFLFGLPTGLVGARTASESNQGGPVLEMSRKENPAPVTARSSWIYQGR